MNPNQALWEKGDFGEIAAWVRGSGEAFVRSLGIEPPLRALDLGCGDGTTALPLAEAGADVVGIDIARNLVEAGRKRAAAAGLERLTFQVGDACDLQGVADRSFDLTLSMFGAMFAPRPFDAAGEMVRVTKSGGRIVMGTWIPNEQTSFVSQMFKINATFLPPPPEGFVSPMLWGVEPNIVERFAKAGVPEDRISMERDALRFSLPDKTASEMVDALRAYFAPAMMAFEAAESAGRERELYAQLVDLVTAQNQSTGTGVTMSATFMRITVRL